MVYGAAAAGAEHSYAVGFVDHHAGVVLLGQTHDLGYVGHVTFHREYAVGHDELDLVGITLLKLGLERCHVVVLVLQLLGERQASTLDDRGVILFVPQYVVLASGKARHNAEVHLEPCRVDHHIFLADIFGDSGLELLVQIQCAVEKR